MSKRIISIAIALTMVVLMAGCIIGNIPGSGNLTTETHDLSDFSRIEAHNGFELEITMSNTFSIEITADDNVQEYVEVEKSGNTLSIRLLGTRFYDSVTLRARVTMPDLYKIELTGGSQAAISGFSSAHDFEADLSGGSQLSGDITAGDAEFELSGGSQVSLEGSGDDLFINASGGSQLDLEDFLIDNADINLSGGSWATININGILDANLSGGSRVEYVGDPNLGDINLSGASTVSQK